jgi:hypothetical protein
MHWKPLNGDRFGQWRALVCESAKKSCFDSLYSYQCIQKRHVLCGQPEYTDPGGPVTQGGGGTMMAYRR